MNVVDSSAWIEYFAAGPNADTFAPAVEGVRHLVVPTIAVFEVFKHVLRHRDEDAALRAVVQMRRGKVAELDESTALEAARLSIEFRLPMADSVILATSRRFSATLWTQDAGFEGIPGVEYHQRK